jgi:hypothetical protein
MDVLDKQYKEKSLAYDSLIDETLQNPGKIEENLEKIKTLNVEISKTLDEMIAFVTRDKNQKNIDTLRDDLVYKLQRIQRDYNGLLVNTDKLETLRRIRHFEEKGWKRTVLIYLIIFLVLAVVLLLFMFFRRQKSETATTTPMIAANTAPLT